MLLTEKRYGPRLALTLCSYSSEDETHPARSLRVQNRSSCGWQSGKHCPFPQELVFHFEGQVQLDSVRLLIHECKIPTCVEVFIADSKETEPENGVCSSFDSADFSRLGHVRFSTNEVNRFMARELKTVGVQSKLTYLKLVFRRPHRNTYNLFDQVGLVAISAHGRVLRNFNVCNALTHCEEVQVGEVVDIPLNEMMPMTIEEANTFAAKPVHFSQESKKRLAELRILKAQAVVEEDYDLADALKRQIEFIDKSTAHITKLEQEKADAVRAEDYLRAKELKRQIDQLREAGERRPTVRPGSSRLSTPPDASIAPTATLQPRAKPLPLRRSTTKPVVDHNELAAVGKGFYDLGDETGGIAVSSPSMAMGSEVGVAGRGGSWERQLNGAIQRCIPSDQSAPSALSGTLAAEGAPYEKDLGVFCVACLCARRGQLREAAIRGLASQEGYAALSMHTQTGLDTLILYLASKGRGVGDAVAAVVFASCEVILKILRGQLPGAPSVGTLTNSFNKLVPELIARMGDANGRIRENIEEVITTLARSQFGPSHVIDLLLVNPDRGKRPASYRAHLSRIHLLSTFAGAYGVNPANAHALDIDALMTKAVLPSLQHPNGEVRDAAVRLFAKLLHLDKVASSPYLSEEYVKPAQRALLEEQLNQGEGAVGDPRAVGADLVSDTVSVRRTSRERPLGSASRVKKPSVVDALVSYGPMQSSTSIISSSEAVALPDGAEPELEGPAPYTCQFCGEYNESFTDSALDIHYVRACPMLCPCPLCDQVTEIATLQQHLVSECDGQHLVRECPRCREAIRAEDFKQHVSTKDCIPSRPSVSVCPLCHSRFTSNMDGWRKHLAASPGCPNNPRRFDGSGEV